ncbi:uncharacterized protein LOC121237085 isoform X2 [Juglans microcarpa x Juglans regia]|uniref:uncharacterized protein LOC121237085 isoform X2 n=1 Tax=Juglans microcarpa x Juglans regia TaxID=2249226 RepID=UPI001B7F587B|nr:uncharacterized protein LOC121237085 isoform X2 [Juglans microcarpa x Juglans regia]
MRKVKYRTLRELYNATEEKVVEPTKGSSCTDQFDTHFTSSTFQMGEESRTGNLSGKAEEWRTCNASTTPCLARMHLEQVLSPIKADLFSDETCNRRAACGSSPSDADLLSPSSNSGCNGKKLTSSEISNVFGSYWPRDSFSKDIGLKATSRSTNVSENIDMLLKANTCPTYKGKHGFQREKIINPQIYTNKLQKQKEISSLRDFYASANLIKGELSDHPEEHVESSLKEVATFRISGQMQDVDSHAESMINGSAMNDRNPAVKVVLCSDLKDHVEKSSAVAEEPNIQEPPLQSQLVDYNDNSLTFQDKVKVCDICGDTGREELLAICSKCSDGAEHIYCMHVMLDKVPEAGWKCEECMLDSKLKSQPSKDVDQKWKLVCNTASKGQRKEGVSRKLCNPISFENDIIHSSNAAYAMVKRLCPGYSHAENLKRSGHTTECKSTQGKHASEFHPTVSSLVADSGISSSSVKEIASRSENFSSGSNYHDLEAIQGHEQSYNSLNPFGHLAQQGLIYSVGRDDVSQLPIVPQLHCIWQGGFQICRNGRLPSSCSGVQAHLSTRASPEVFDVVFKLPQKVILEEVPRLSTWPTQFSENLATEDNIALYFFAKDPVSYERNYKSLLECMINNDLALKGNLDGVELLIFSSNFLPEKSWRWNKLYFLWGVFRGRSVCRSRDLQNSQRIQERDTKKQETDLKPYFQERGEHNVDQERECKRIKSCYSMPSGERLPPVTNGYVPTFSIENLKWGGVNDMSASSAESQIQPSDGEDQSEPGVLDLELRLGAKNKSKKQVAMPSFLGIMGNKTDEDKHSELLTNNNTKVYDEVSTSLSLSLPFSNKEQV